jgi:hypothetical protein
MFVRFIIADTQSNPYESNGLFAAMTWGDVFDRLDPHAVEFVTDHCEWFRDNLPVPPFRSNQELGIWSRRAVCWFKDCAGEPLRRMWDFVAIYREYAIPVRLIRTDRPGKIVYEDDFQVVAETPSVRQQDRRLLPRREVIRLRKRK